MVKKLAHGFVAGVMRQACLISGLPTEYSITHTQRRLRTTQAEGEKRMDWKTLLAYITGTVDQEVLVRNEYLVTENRILDPRAHLNNNDNHFIIVRLLREPHFSSQSE